MWKTLTYQDSSTDRIMAFTRLKAAVAAVALGAVCLMPGPSLSAVIVDTTAGFDGSRFTLGDFGPGIDQDPLGQSFVLSESASNLTIGAIFEDVNPNSGPTFSITISLLSGAGTGGPVLGSSSFTLADGFEGFFAADFSFVGELLAGTYTALFSSGVFNRGGIGVTGPGQGDPLSDPYSDDGLLALFDEPTRDFAVRVTGDFGDDPVALSEPTSLALLGLGLLGFGIVHRRRQRQSVT